MNWKTAVHRYVSQKNASEGSGSLNFASFPVMERKALAVVEKRATRQDSSYRDRAVDSVKNETRLTIHDIKEDHSAAEVVIEMKRLTNYVQEGRNLTEERVEKERLTLHFKNGEWCIVKIEPVGQEVVKRTMDPLQKPLPYINTTVLSGSDVSNKKRYDRAKAREYAMEWWNSYNPKYLHFEVDCTNYVSQCLIAGGAPMNYTGRRESGWWYSGKQGNRELWSYSWAVANSLQQYLSMSKTGLRAQIVEYPQQLTIGDVICYDWDGDGRYQHNTIVVAKDAKGMPLVNAHTTNSRYRYWEYKDSPAWTQKSVYRFFHIADEF